MAPNALIGIYETLRELGYCKDQGDFSTRWLGKSEGYFAYLKSSEGRPCVAALGMLAGLIFAVVPPISDSRDYETRRKLRSAWIAAVTMFEGEREIQFVPRHLWCTAIGTNPAMTLPTRARP